MKAISDLRRASMTFAALLLASWSWPAAVLAAEPAAGDSAAVSTAPVDSNTPHSAPAPLLDEDEDEEEDGPGPSQASLAFLIPAEGDVIYASDVKIVAYVQGPTPPGMLAVLDGFSLERPLRLEDGMLSVELPGMRPGVHEIKVIFLDDKQQIQLSRTVRFFVRVPEPHHKPAKGSLRQYGRVLTQLDWKGMDAQSQIVKQSKATGLVSVPDTTPTGFHDSLVVEEGEAPLSQNLDGAAEVSYAIKYDRLEGYLKGLLRTDENEFRQPSHRFSGRMALGPWAMVRGGDIYPVYNNYILNGTRVRGGEVNLAAVTDDGEKHWVYAKAVTGETKREIKAYVAQYDTGNGGVRYDTVSGSPAQRLTAFRMGAGGGQNFDLGFTVMKASERTGDSLSQAMNEFLHGIQPVENLATGLDLRVGIWDGRIQLFGTWAASMFTRDRSLGPDSNAENFRSIFVANSSTRGWQYFISDSAHSADIPGFINVNSAYEAGITTSIPIAGIVSETEFRYSHLGMEYHSEGNPFLGTNPGNGWNLQQRLVVLDNRLFFGVEVESFLQELGLYKQDERAFKGEIRFLPGAYRPAFWINGGITARAPRGNYPYQFSQDFDQVNVGGFHQMRMGSGTLHGTLLYGFTRSELKLTSTDTSAADSLLKFPVSQTHIVNSAFQYKFRGSDFAPKVSYTFANNGVQQPTSNVAVGLVDAFFAQQLRLDFDVLVGQYPKSLSENDLSLGENFTVVVRVGENQSVRLREKWIQYGDRTSVSAGAYYEMFF